MKYVCVKDSKHVFIHPAKKTLHDREYVKIAEYKDFELETYQCPFCGSLEYAEYVEPVLQVESAIQADWNMVDEYLKQGYAIVDRYAKNATLFKYKKEEVKQ